MGHKTPNPNYNLPTTFSLHCCSKWVNFDQQLSAESEAGRGNERGSDTSRKPGSRATRKTDLEAQGEESERPIKLHLGQRPLGGHHEDGLTCGQIGANTRNRQQWRKKRGKGKWWRKDLELFESEKKKKRKKEKKEGKGKMRTKEKKRKEKKKDPPPQTSTPCIPIVRAREDWFLLRKKQQQNYGGFLLTTCVSERLKGLGE